MIAGLIMTDLDLITNNSDLFLPVWVVVNHFPLLLAFPLCISWNNAGSKLKGWESPQFTHEPSIHSPIFESKLLENATTIHAYLYFQFCHYRTHSPVCHTCHKRKSIYHLWCRSEADKNYTTDHWPLNSQLTACLIVFLLDFPPTWWKQKDGFFPTAAATIYILGLENNR